MRVLVAGRQGRRSDSYVCKRGGHVRRSRPGLDDLVTRIVVGRLAQPDAVAALARSDGAEAQQAADHAEAVRSRLDVAADAYAAGEIDGQQLKRITGRLRPELDRWQQVARAATTAPDLIDLASPDIAQRWESLPLARKRAVIDMLLDVVVMPTTRRGGSGVFDPESVRVTWKGQS